MGPASGLLGSIILDAVERLAPDDDPKTDGKRVCIDLLHEFAWVDGVHGAQVMAPRNRGAIAEVVAQARST